jgi:hypothetical protein
LSSAHSWFCLHFLSISIHLLHVTLMATYFTYGISCMLYLQFCSCLQVILNRRILCSTLAYTLMYANFNLQWNSLQNLISVYQIFEARLCFLVLNIYRGISFQGYRQDYNVTASKWESSLKVMLYTGVLDLDEFTYS